MFTQNRKVRINNNISSFTTTLIWFSAITLYALKCDGRYFDKTRLFMKTRKTKMQIIHFSNLLTSIFCRAEALWNLCVHSLAKKGLIINSTGDLLFLLSHMAVLVSLVNASVTWWSLCGADVAIKIMFWWKRQYLDIKWSNWKWNT